jgi:hypothetical protein
MLGELGGCASWWLIVVVVVVVVVAAAAAEKSNGRFYCAGSQAKVCLRGKQRLHLLQG